MDDPFDDKVHVSDNIYVFLIRINRWSFSCFPLQKIFLNANRFCKLSSLSATCTEYFLMSIKLWLENIMFVKSLFVKYGFLSRLCNSILHS